MGKAGTNNSCRCQAFVAWYHPSIWARKYLQEYVEAPAPLGRMIAGLVVLTWQVLPSSGTIGLYTTHRSLKVVCRSDSFGPRKSSPRTGANSCQPRKRITKRINVFICHTTLAKFTALIHRPPVLKRWLNTNLTKYFSAFQHHTQSVTIRQQTIGTLAQL